jgi:hypothetical protein
MTSMERGGQVPAIRIRREPCPATAIIAQTLTSTLTYWTSLTGKSLEPCPVTDVIAQTQSSTLTYWTSLTGKSREGL